MITKDRNRIEFKHDIDAALSRTTVRSSNGLMHDDYDQSSEQVQDL